jgi:hypothetical protein
MDNRETAKTTIEHCITVRLGPITFCTNSFLILTYSQFIQFYYSIIKRIIQQSTIQSHIYSLIRYSNQALYPFITTNLNTSNAGTEPEAES